MLETFAPKDRLLVDALRSTRRNAGLTHSFYRYPARFGSDFVREAIKYFTKPGEVVLDPFMGGGTTAVEALSLGRRFVGSDVNELALFISAAKSGLISKHDEGLIRNWARAVPNLVDTRRPEIDDGYGGAYKHHIPWQMRRTLSQALASLGMLESERQVAFARCSLLSVGQWALDCRTHTPPKKSFLERHASTIEEMLKGMGEFRAALKSYDIDLRSLSKYRSLLHSSASQLHERRKATRLGTPKLVLTSPPYLGVHVLYHRWQINGRRETAAPYWLAGRSDGNTGVYYTFADRRSPQADKYMQRLRECFSSICSLLSKESRIVQVVAFSDVDIHLPMYLRTLEELGLESCDVFDRSSAIDRSVPNRRWYALLSQQSTSSREFMLVHRLKKKGRVKQ